MVAVFSSSALCLLSYMDRGRKISVNIDEPLSVYDAKIAGCHVAGPRGVVADKSS